MGICSSRSFNPEITSRSERYHPSKITNISGQYHHIKVPDTPPLFPTKNKGPLYDYQLAHTAYMNNVARARRSTGTPHYSQLLKPQHLVRRKPPNPFRQHKKTTSPVRCILTSQKRVAPEFINCENMDLLSTDDVSKDENCGVVEESTSKNNVKPCPSQTICDISVNASSDCNIVKSNEVSALEYNNVNRESGTSPEAQQKEAVQTLNQQTQPTFSLFCNDDANSRINDRYSTIYNNGDLRSLHRNNATQTSPSPSRISNHSSNSYDDSEVMKSIKFPRETAVFYMMHSEEVSQEFRAKKRHGFCRDYSTSEGISTSSLAARDCRSSQKRRNSKYVILEFEKESPYPLKGSEAHYQDAEKPLIHEIIKEESAEYIESGRTLNSGDGAEAPIEMERHYKSEKRSNDLENISSLERCDTQRDLKSNNGGLTHSELGHSELLDENEVTKILSRQELVTSGHSGFLSCQSCEYQSTGIENDIKGKNEDVKTDNFSLRRRFSELNIPVDKVLHEHQLRRHPGPRRVKPASFGPHAGLNKFHAHGDGFVRSQQYVGETLCCKHEEELKLTGLFVSNREGMIARHRSRHERSRHVAPPCPPSTPCSGVCSTENIKSEIVNAELIEDSPLLKGCMIRSQRKPTSPPLINIQEETYSNRTVIPKETTDTDDYNLNHHARFRSDDESSIKDMAYEEMNKLLSDATSSDCELRRNPAQTHRVNSANLEVCAEQLLGNNRAGLNTARMSTKEASSLRASELHEGTSSKLMNISKEKKIQKCSHISLTQNESNYTHKLLDESQPKCKMYEENKCFLHKHNISENKSINKLIPDTQESVNQHDTEKSKKKQDEKTNTCYNQYASFDTPIIPEIQRQDTTHNEACTSNVSKGKRRPCSLVSKYSEQLSYLEKFLRKGLQSNKSSESGGVQHEVVRHRHPSAPEAPQFAQIIADTIHKQDVSKIHYQPGHNSHQEPEKGGEEPVSHHLLNKSRVRYCPIHRQHVKLQEEGLIPSLHSLNAGERYHCRRHHFQPRQHYCTIHHRMFTMDMLPQEQHLLHGATDLTEREENPFLGMPSHMKEDLSDNPTKNLSSLAPRCRSLVAMFERQNVVLSGRNLKVEEENISAAMNGVNGVNGHHGELNGGGELINSQTNKGCWTIGLINSKFRYLTAETFGFKINANGASLKKKQVWTLEPATGDSAILLRSHLDKYLAVDTFGNVTCETEERDDPGTKFQISVADDGNGRWALRNITRGYFLGASSDKLTCTAKVPGDAELWHVHLAARPQVNLRSVGRKRFAHLSENLDEIHVDANIPWGEDTLFTLEFRADDNGKYALHTCNNKYLSREGKLVDTCTPNCLFSAEYHAGQLALRDRTGAYLSPIGSKAVLKSRSTTVTKDELFSLEDSLPQASFVAGLNSRYVSVKQGVDVTANQDEISDHETFQLEFDSSTKRWYIRTMQDRYWTLETGGGIQASGDKRSSNALFDLVWQRDGSVAFRANNGKFVSTKRSGHLYANCDNVEDNSKYFFYLINRPILVLKCEQGFVGYKSASSPKLECNKATYETIQVERSEKGVVFFKGQNGKYWHVDGESVTADSDVPEGFFIELRDPTHICIKSTSGDYLVASKNGSFRLGDSDYENATKWEY